MRGVVLVDADLDGEMEGLRIWGVEVAPLVEAELDRRHPERVALHRDRAAERRTGGPAWRRVGGRVEEWHHHRYAVRDLDVIDTRRA